MTYVRSLQINDYEYIRKSALDSQLCSEVSNRDAVKSAHVLRIKDIVNEDRTKCTVQMNNDQEQSVGWGGRSIQCVNLERSGENMIITIREQVAHAWGMRTKNDTVVYEVRPSTITISHHCEPERRPLMRIEGYPRTEGRHTFCINPDTRAMSMNWDSDSTAVNNVSNIWKGER